MLIEQLKKKFAAGTDVVALDVNKQAEEEKIQPCKKCNGQKFWKPKNRDDWLCKKCFPFPTVSMVAEIIDLRWGKELDHPGQTEPEATPGPSRLVESFIVLHSAPVCRKCGCRSTIERWWSDGQTDERCECCGGPASWETRPRWEGRLPRRLTVSTPETASQEAVPAGGEQA